MSALWPLEERGGQGRAGEGRGGEGRRGDVCTQENVTSKPKKVTSRQEKITSKAATRRSYQ